MKTILIATLAALSAGSAMAQGQTSAPAQGGPATGVPVLEGAQAAPDCGALSVPASQAFCVTAPLASMQSVGDAYIARFQSEGWEIVVGEANYLIFARRRTQAQCEGLQMIAFYDTALPDTPTTPGFLGFGTIPSIPCAERADGATAQ
ncbi:hypothetical protein GVN24_29350 [Rhizobium sp. CRIBSB]|nr:hypothetical protein [Rhizobium sp. CRIBSB]